MSEQPTTKQFGDACEMLVAARLTFADRPAAMMPSGWPDYDLIVQYPKNSTPQRISVKARGERRSRSTSTHTYRFGAEGWDWIAFVFVPIQGPERIWILPANVALDASAPDGDDRQLQLKTLTGDLSEWEKNYSLNRR